MSTRTAMAAEVLAELSKLTAAEVRARLPDLFRVIDEADDSSAPLIASLADRALEGAEGLAALRHESTLQFVLHGLGHPDVQTRAQTIAQCTRLATSAADVSLLVERGVTQRLAAAVGDAELRISQKAVGFFVACAQGGSAGLGKVLGDAATINKLKSLSSAIGRGASVLALRALALFAEMAATGNEQMHAVGGCGLLEPALELWRGDDPLVRLNAVELFGTLARTSAGFDWLDASGVVSETVDCLTHNLCPAPPALLAAFHLAAPRCRPHCAPRPRQVRELVAFLDVPVGDDPLQDLLRPAVLCRPSPAPVSRTCVTHGAHACTCLCPCPCPGAELPRHASGCGRRARCHATTH